MSSWPTQVSAKTTAAVVLKTPSVSNAWQIGTVLKALALSDSVDGKVQLQIGARVVTAQTSLPLQSGQTLRLQVAETGRTVVLRTVEDVVRSDPIRAAIRQTLPRQMPQAPLLASAMSLGNTQQSPELAVAVTRLLSAVPVSHTLTDGQGLRSAVHDSGIFLENRLAQALSRDKTAPTTAMPRDWKAALLRFRDQLTQLRVNLAGSTGPKQAPAALPGSGTAQVIRAAPATSTATRPASVQVTPAVITTQTTAPTSTATPNLPLASTPMPAAAISNAPSSVPAAATQPISAQSVALAVPPPMRHALPHAQPVAQPPVLPTDLLSLVGELIGNSDGALARVRLNQLASVTPEHNNRLVWLLELPVRHDDNRAEIVALRIEKEGEGQSAEQNAAWTADLAFDLGTKGELRARVALRAGRISVSFWADVESTRSEVNEKLSGLQDTMEKKQLDVGCLSCGAGRPADPPAPQASLLETQA